MQQYSMLQAIVMSFYSGKLYRDVAINWGGKTFLYLLLILALSWIVDVFQLQRALTTNIGAIPDSVISQIPVLTIKDGKLSTPENRPYIITDPQTHETLAVIDTSGKYTSLDQINGGVLITQTSVITQNNTNEIKENKIPNHLTVTLVPETIKKNVQYYMHYAWMPLYIILLLIAYFYRIIQAFLYGIIGKIFSVIGNIPVTYSQIVQVTMVAITPVIVISTILDALNVSLPHALLLYFVLAMLYMFYGLIANKKLTETHSTTNSQ